MKTTIEYAGEYYSIYEIMFIPAKEEFVIIYGEVIKFDMKREIKRNMERFGVDGGQPLDFATIVDIVTSDIIERKSLNGDKDV